MSNNWITLSKTGDDLVSYFKILIIKTSINEKESRVSRLIP